LKIDLILENSDPIYLFFLNINQTNSWKGSVGIGFRQLNKRENDLYCKRNYREHATKPPVSDDFYNTESVQLRIYSSGCYYIDTDSGEWKTDGMEVLPDTNVNLALTFFY
jgi:hypothetical protein